MGIVFVFSFAGLATSQDPGANYVNIHTPNENPTFFYSFDTDNGISAKPWFTTLMLTATIQSLGSRILVSPITRIICNIPALRMTPLLKIQSLVLNLSHLKEVAAHPLNHQSHPLKKARRDQPKPLSKGRDENSSFNLRIISPNPMLVSSTHLSPPTTHT
ncbi:unnamed protein product [Allacma fusca]|uniref:Uncharacterized protein n=1 Tax=Allacma fusca TaxID=39272 RepID=A0A8J2JKE6_9HEXA|nr:unnamed protein product [Allacma fusca]